MCICTSNQAYSSRNMNSNEKKKKQINVLKPKSGKRTHTHTVEVEEKHEKNKIDAMKSGMSFAQTKVLPASKQAHFMYMSLVAGTIHRCGVARKRNIAYIVCEMAYNFGNETNNKKKIKNLYYSCNIVMLTVWLIFSQFGWSNSIRFVRFVSFVRCFLSIIVVWFCFCMCSESWPK